MIGMIKTILRHPAGTPASQGGKFKAHDRAEADISLDPAIATHASDVPAGDTDRRGPGATRPELPTHRAEHSGLTAPKPAILLTR